MPRLLRYCEPGKLIEVTTRTLQGRLLMRPSPAFNEIFLGTLGRAQALYELDIHAFATLSNHYHLLCSPQDPEQLADFMRLFNSKLAREIVRLHHWHDKVWSRRYLPIQVTDESSAQIKRLHYLLSHGSKEGLVASPRDWPGPHCLDALIAGKPLQGRWFNRTLEYEANRQGLEFGRHDFATIETVKLTPLPCWKDLSTGEYRRRVGELVAQVEEEARIRQRDTGREPRGALFILRQNPHEMPVRSKRSPAPCVHAASRAARRIVVDAYRAFVAAYRRAAERLREGDVTVIFPPRCFPPRLPFVRGSPRFAPG